MSFGGIHLLGGALQALQAAENVIADNISNINTPGASRQSPQLAQADPISAHPGFGTQVIPGTLGQGVTMKEIQRIHDDSVDKLYRGAYSSQNYYTAMNTEFTSLQQNFNEPSGGISQAYNSFQTAVSQLASINTNSSNAASSRANVLSTAKSLVDNLNSVGNSINKQAGNVYDQTVQQVNAINALLDQIATLNGDIREGTAAGEQPNTYLDQRDYAIDQLSQYVPVTVVNQTNGSTLITVNGLAVVNDEVTYHLARPITVNGTNGLRQIVIGQTNDLNQLNPLPVQFGSGSLGGLVDYYNTKLKPYTAKLDAFSASLSQEFNAVNQSGLDQNGQAGTAIFTTAPNTAIAATTITLGLGSPAQLAMASVSTAAGTLTQSMNASTADVTTNAAFSLPGGANPGNSVFSNPAATGGISGTITVDVDNVTKTLAYNTLTTDTDINSFVNRFNALGSGVKASFDGVGQKIVFTRDIGNESLALKGTANYSVTSDFTVSDSNGAVGTQPAAGAQATGILGVLGAGRINGVAQNSTNVFNATDNSNASRLNNVFTNTVGIPPVLETVGTPVVPGRTVEPVPGGLGFLAVGQTITIGAGTANEENVTIEEVDANSVPPTVTVTYAKPHAVGEPVQAALTQSLGAYYANVVSGLGFDASAASSGLKTQTNLTSGIEVRRQAISGINVDEETQKLIKYQVAYQAVARTFSVMQSLLQTTLTQLSP